MSIGRARRPLYKRPRPPARDKGVLSAIKNGLYELAPVALPDANEGEVSKAIFALALQADVLVGRGSGYDGLKDEYTVIGKSRTTGKAQDFKIKGEVVAELIRVARLFNGGKMTRGSLQRQVNQRQAIN